MSFYGEEKVVIVVKKINQISTWNVFTMYNL